MYNLSKTTNDKENNFSVFGQKAPYFQKVQVKQKKENKKRLSPLNENPTNQQSQLRTLILYLYTTWSKTTNEKENHFSVFG